MLCIVFAAFLFTFIVVGCGYFTTLIFSSKNSFGNNFFSIVLTGILVLTVYLNLLSLFFPADYKLLIVPFAISLMTVFKQHYRNWLRKVLQSNIRLLFDGSHKYITMPVMIVLLLFTIVPPYNTDSPGYHFLAIKWNEEFKIVPGLANLFSQFGYNSSFMVLSAAFSLTALCGQSIYALNIVITVLFCCWMLKKYFSNNLYVKFIIVLILFILLRQFPINLSSPSADNLASILVFYILFTLFETSNVNLIHKWKYLFVLACFAVIIKLSTLPLLLVGAVPFICRNKNLKVKIFDLLAVYFIGVVIILLWVIRNIILTGYVVYPFTKLDLFHVDWKVPYDVVYSDNLHVSQATKMAGDNLVAVSKMPLYEWVPMWLPNLWGDNVINCLLVIAGMLSPVLFIVFRNKLRNQYGLYFAGFISYFGILFWINTSPDFRFGYHYLVLGLFLPALSVVQQIKVNNANLLYYGKKLCILIYLVGCIHYAIIAINYLKPYNMVDTLIKPLKNIEYNENNVESFDHVYLTDKIKLYIHDSLHHSINAPLPSCSPYRKGIQLRGNTLQDGFRTKQ